MYQGLLTKMVFVQKTYFSRYLTCETPMLKVLRHNCIQHRLESQFDNRLYSVAHNVIERIYGILTQETQKDLQFQQI